MKPKTDPGRPPGFFMVQRFEKHGKGIRTPNSLHHRFYICTNLSFVPGKVRTLNEIADLYGVHRNTLRKWLKPINGMLKMGKKRLLFPWQIKVIFEFLDYPEGWEKYTAENSNAFFDNIPSI